MTHFVNQLLEKTEGGNQEWTIQTHTGNIEHTRHRMMTNNDVKVPCRNGTKKIIYSHFLCERL